MKTTMIWEYSNLIWLTEVYFPTPKKTKSALIFQIWPMTLFDNKLLLSKALTLSEPNRFIYWMNWKSYKRNQKPITLPKTHCWLLEGKCAKKKSLRQNMFSKKRKEKELITWYNVWSPIKTAQETLLNHISRRHVQSNRHSLTVLLSKTNKTRYRSSLAGNTWMVIWYSQIEESM